MKKILWIGDGVAKTGFSTVNMSIIENLTEDFEIHHLAINYSGDPHEYGWKIYPAMIGGDLWGFNRLKSFYNNDYDMIFILNDVWVIDKYLKIIKDNFTRIPPIVVYFPVDSEDLDKEWFRTFDIVTKIVVYTEFGYKEVKKVFPGDVEIIPHGINLNLFHKIDRPKQDIKRMIFPNRDEFVDSFIVLNANRNQPRKRIDITVEGFSLFAKNKPDNVKLYLHMGLKDVGWDLVKLTERFGVHSRLIVTGRVAGVQSVPEDKLNTIYNACDIGLNTAIGEGWGLTNFEHAITGAPQVVPNNSALYEIYKDCGALIPTSYHLLNVETLTKSRVVTPEDVANKLEELYNDRELQEKLSKSFTEKFVKEEYTWKYISENYWKKLLEDVMSD